jgi:peroxiredoxin
MDGTELPPAELDRVAVGEPAPDFRLTALVSEPVRLSDFRGSKDVVLVFYRGHW